MTHTPQSPDSKTPEQIIKAIGQDTEVLEFGTTPARAFILISYLQLAMRHPGTDPQTNALVLQFCKNLEAAIATRHPEAKALIDAGLNPENDVTREEFDALYQSGAPLKAWELLDPYYPA